MTKVEPEVRRLLRSNDIDVRLMARAINVEKHQGDEIVIDKIVLAGGETIEGDVLWKHQAQQNRINMHALESLGLNKLILIKIHSIDKRHCSLGGQA